MPKSLHKIFNVNELYETRAVDWEDMHKHLFLGVATPEEQRKALRMLVQATPLMSQIPPEVQPMIGRYGLQQLEELKETLRGEMN